MLAVPLILLSGLAGLAALPGHASAAKVIKDDSHFFGQSPPIYPSPEMSGQGDWAEAFNRAKKMVGRMSLQEKVNLTGGVDAGTSCSGSIPAVKSVGFPGMCLSDAGQGLRATDFVSSFPSGIHVGASWNRDLTRQRGAAMGMEFKTKGVNVLLGPVVGPAGRVVQGGRNWEGISVDPYLSGALVYETTVGIQSSNVITSTKHYIANEQELNRNPGENVTAISSNIDDRTMHELYLWAFQDAVKAGSGNIMCSYQRINNSYGCQNSKTLNGLLKTELGFQGFVVTDWGALHAGVDAAQAGLDMAMPTGEGFWSSELVKAVKNGTVPESRVTDMATRIVAAWYQMGQDTDFPKPGIGMPDSVTEPHEIVDGRDPEAQPTRLNGAIEGHVLVKNTKNTLPLRAPRMLSLFGYSARAPDLFAPASDFWGSSAWMGGGEPQDPKEKEEEDTTKYSGIAPNGTMINGGGSGATTPALYISPFEAIQMKAYQNNTAIFHDFRTNEPIVDPATDTCIVFANAWASEGYDRPNVRDDWTDDMIKTVADQCSKTVVIFHNAGVRLVDEIVDHDNVTAIIFAHLPGEETGHALVSLLWGESSFSGKLPYTVAKKASDYGDVLKPDEPKGQYKIFPQSDFDEGVYIDYRYFDKKDIEPQFEFGFGLSYTTFKFSQLKVAKDGQAKTQPLPLGAVTSGGQADLWDTVATVTATVTNTGKVAGAEVAQLYVGIPNAPVRQLRGFEKPFLQPGESATVSFDLTRRDLSIWDTGAQKWRLQKGKYAIHVGSSSRKLALKGSLRL